MANNATAGVLDRGQVADTECRRTCLWCERIAFLWPVDGDLQAQDQPNVSAMQMLLPQLGD